MWPKGEVCVGLPITIMPGVTWGTIDGVAVLRFLGNTLASNPKFAGLEAYTLACYHGSGTFIEPVISVLFKLFDSMCWASRSRGQRARCSPSSLVSLLGSPSQRTPRQCVQLSRCTSRLCRRLLRLAQGGTCAGTPSAASRSGDIREQRDKAVGLAPLQAPALDPNAA